LRKIWAWLLDLIFSIIIIRMFMDKKKIWAAKFQPRATTALSGIKMVLAFQPQANGACMELR